MKYIRTNYLFGEIVSHTKLLNGTHLFSIKGLDEILPISEEDFEKHELKVADTIEELCDEFVAIDIGVFGDKTKSYKTIKEVEEDKTFLFDKLYGAIWTDKGLIYVAKMNNKGELELL